MTVTDWRTMPADRMAPLYAVERQRWLNCLHWDYTATLADIERARVGGQLQGAVALSGRRIAGWVYFLTHRSALLIGGLHAVTADAARQLLQAALRSDAARQAATMIAFGYFDAPDIERVCTDAGLVVEPYEYLSLDLHDEPAGAMRDAVRYDVGRNAAVARLLRDAYAMAPASRPFAIRGTDDEWIEYVAQLTVTNGCGEFDAASSLIDRDGRGVAIVSAVSPSTAHLCQLAVRPDATRNGLGQQLLRAACARAKDNGRARMTLTVASSNTAAVSLYRRFGFTEIARFTFARR